MPAPPQTPTVKTTGRSTGTTFTTASTTPASNSLQLLFVWSSAAAAPNAPTATGNGLTWVQVATIVFGTTRRLTVLRALGASPTAGAITISFAGQSQNGGKWTLVQIAGVSTSGTNGSGAIAASNTGSGASGTSANVSAGSITDGNQMLIAGTAHAAAEASTTEFPALADFVSGDAAGLAIQWGGDGVDNDAFTLWGTSSSWGMISILVQPSTLLGAGPTDYPVPFLDFSTTPPSSVPLWQGIEDDLQAFSVFHGRAFELDAFETGGQTYTLDNSSGNYRIGNTSGAHYGKWKQKRRVRFGFVWEGQRKFLADGFIQSVAPTRSGEWGQVVVTCVDAFETFAHRELVPDVAVLTTTQGSNRDLRFTARGSSGSFGGSGGVGAIFGGGLQAPGGPGEGITIAYDASINDYPPPPDVEVDGYAITVHLHTIGSTPDSLAYNIMRAVNSHQFAGRLVTVTLAPGSNGSGVPSAMSATPLVGGYPQELSGTRLTRVLSSMGWTLGRDLDAGQRTIQATQFERADHVKGLGHMQDVARSESGQVFIDGRGRVVFQDSAARGAAPFNTSSGTFSDDPAIDTGAYEYEAVDPRDDTERLYNSVSVSRNNGGTSTVVDATSQDEYDPRELSIATILSSDAQLTTIANALLARYKDPKTRYDSIRLRPTKSGDPLFDVLFSLDISHQIVVKEHPPGSSTQSLNCYIEAVRFESGDVRADPLDLVATWQLSPV